MVIESFKETYRLFYNNIDTLATWVQAQGKEPDAEKLQKDKQYMRISPLT